MYLLIHNQTTVVGEPYTDKDAAFDARDALRAIASADDHYEVHCPALAPDATSESLELLYSLAIQLLKVGKVDPLHISVELTNLIGDTRTLTARQIVNDARIWIDNNAP